MCVAPSETDCRHPIAAPASPRFLHLPFAGLPASDLHGEARASLADAAAQMARLLFVSCAGSLVMLALTLRLRLT